MLYQKNDPYKERQRQLDAVFPKWAKRRDSQWIYCGYIAADGDGYSKSQQQCIEEHIAAGPHNGQVREVDMYPEGAVCWYRKI